MINIEGKSVPIEVELDETVKSVKLKIEDKEGIPVCYQCLVFNGKPLMDEKTLLDYNIQKDSNLRINLQAWDQSAYSESHVEPPVDWSKLATAAKEKVDQEVEEKKVLYEKLLRTKVETARNAKQVEAEMKSREIQVQIVAEQILEEENKISIRTRHIEKLKQELKRSMCMLDTSLKRKKDMEEDLDEEQYEMEEKRKKLSSLEAKVSNLDSEIHDNFLLAGESVVKKNKDLASENKKHKDDLKSFLDKSISAKEALLECPVCYQTASPPIYKCSMEHLICNTCLPRMRDRCPTCRAEFSRSEMVFRLAEEMWTELQNLKEMRNEKSDDSTRGDEESTSKQTVELESESNEQEQSFFNPFESSDDGNINFELNESQDPSEDEDIYVF